MMQICNDYCKSLIQSILIWLCGLAGVRLLPDGCRAIPAGHFNFDPALALELGGRDGVTQAIIYEKINGWLLHYEKRGRDYVYNNLDQWADQIPFWHARTIGKHIQELVGRGHLERRRPAASAPSVYKKPVIKDSDSLNQMLLPSEDFLPTVGTKDSDSSIHKPAFQKPSTNKQTTATPARVVPPFPKVTRKSKTLNGAAVATLPGMGEKDQDLPEPKPQVAEARPGNEDFDQADGTNAPTPVSADPPSEFVRFFTGCSPDEVADLVERYGDTTLEDARIYAEADKSIANPAGYVRAQLAKGWRPPKPAPRADYSWAMNRTWGEHLEYLEQFEREKQETVEYNRRLMAERAAVLVQS